MEMHRDHRGFPGAGSGASVTPHSHDQLQMSTPDMRDNAIRPITKPSLRVGDVMPACDLYAIDHSDVDEPAEWELYRKVGETRDYCSVHGNGTYMSHHVLMDRTGRKWRIDWRSFLALAQDDIIRKVHLHTPTAQAIAERVEAGQIGWQQALQALHELGAAEERVGGDGAPEEYPVLGTHEQNATAETVAGDGHDE